MPRSGTEVPHFRSQRKEIDLLMLLVPKGTNARIAEAIFNKG